MTEFKVGDKVECLMAGSGVVISVIDRSHGYSVAVEFKTSAGVRLLHYTSDGKFSKDSKRTLTKGTWEVEEILPKVTFNKGEHVWADLGYGDGWQVFKYLGNIPPYNDEHFVGGTAKGSEHMNISFPDKVDSKHIRKFKDNPYEVN